MKILWLAHEGNISGANICLLEYLEILGKHKIKSHLIVPFSQNMELKKAAEKKSIEVSLIKFYPWTSPSVNSRHSFINRVKRWYRNQLAVKEITKLIGKVEPDFVATNTITASVAALAAKKTNKKHIWFVHEFGEEDHGFSISGGFIKAAAIMNALSDKIVFNSVSVQDKYEDAVQEINKKNIVRYAIIMPLIKPIEKVPSENIFRLIMLGQVAVSKNHTEAIKALKICKEKGLHFELSIAGNAENCTFLTLLVTLIYACGLNNHVKFLGPLSEPYALLSQQHTLLMCSRKEAFGRVTAEALKLGIPVIAADSGGSLEIVEDTCDGYFYKGGNEKDLADKIMLLHNNYSQFDKNEISKRAVKKFNEENTYRQLMDVFC